MSKRRGRNNESAAVQYLRAAGADAWDVHGEDNGVSDVTPEDIVAWPPGVDPSPWWPDGDDSEMLEVQVKYRSDGGGFRKVYRLHADQADTSLGKYRTDVDEANLGRESVVYWGRYDIVTGSVAAWQAYHEHGEPVDLVETDWQLGEQVQCWLPDLLVLRAAREPFALMWHWSMGGGKDE